MWRKGTLCAIGENVNWCSHYGKQQGGFSKQTNKNYRMIQQSQFWVYIQKEQNQDFKEIPTPMFIAALFTITEVWKQLKCPLVDERIKKMWDSSLKKKEILRFATT